MPTISSPSSNLNLKWRWGSIWKCLKNAKNPAGWNLFPSADENDDDCWCPWWLCRWWWHLSNQVKRARQLIEDTKAFQEHVLALPAWNNAMFQAGKETYLQTRCYRQSLKIMSLRHIQCISPNIFQNKFIYGKLIMVYMPIRPKTHIYNIGLVVCVQFEFLHIYN